jgi:DNA-binding response OmpR family regulator
MRILLVEDDALLGDGLRAGLQSHGYEVNWQRDGAAALAALNVNGPSGEAFAAVVLDLGLPRLDGLAVLRALRGRGDATPVLILTARDTVADKIDGLDAGADDYLIKPFDLDELAARLRALIRRGQGRPTPLLLHGPLSLDLAARRASLDGQPLELSGREFALLEILLANAGRALTRAQLEAQLYGWDSEVDSNAIEVHIHHLRKKCGGDLIRTLRGVGYMIDKADKTDKAGAGDA